MKSFVLPFLFLATVVSSSALTSTQTGYATQAVTVSSPNFSFDFAIDWSCDDYPASSAPGRIELRDDGGNLVARLSASVYRGTGPSYSLSGGSSVTNDSFWMFRYAADGTPADGSLQGTWNVTGLAPGSYTLRLYGYSTNDIGRHATTVWTNASVSSSYPTSGQNRAPTIDWISAPAGAANGAGYYVAAQGHDADGNLTQVNLWKNGQPFAFAGGGNGTDGDSGNWTSDSGPQFVTFTAQAVDAAGETSSIITHTVTISAPTNNPPTVTLLSPGGQTVTAGTTLTVSSHATDPEGNITSHNLDIQRPDGAWNYEGGFATGEPYQGGPVGSGGDSTRSAAFTFTEVGTYHVRSAAADSSGWHHSATVDVTVVPANQPPTVAWTSTPGTVSSGQTYSIAAHGHDSDGNLSQVQIWKNGAPFSTAAVSGTDGDASASSSDTGPTTITYTAQAVDSAGAVSATISQTVTINAPPPVQYTLMTIAAAGGTVSAGGTFTSGTTVSVAAVPDATHDFAGWSGDAGGSTNPLGILMDRNKTVQANFTPRTFALITSASGGGGVSPGGTYPYGTVVTVTATPDATHRFNGWAGDVSGMAPSVTLTVTRALAVQAVFDLKAAQTITFPAIADQNVGAGVPLNITSSSGLPVTVTVTGPASYAAGVLTLTGPGAVSVQATQAGDGTYLAAAPVTRSFNSAAPVVLRYRATGRTILQTGRTAESIPYVIQPNP